MRCHYDVLALPLTASQEDIKKSYRSLALKLHPDRNIGNEEVAAEKFKELLRAYEVLSDINEKKWYDSHRSSILRGANPHDPDDDFHSEFTKSEELWSYFNTSCYDNYDDNIKGFYTVYNTCFQDIYTLELQSENGLNLPLAPLFGTSTSISSDVLNFYNFWTNFTTILSFSWVDKYNPNEAPNRDVRRLIEKENKKERDIAKKAYVDQVRELAIYVRKRDPRIRIIEQEKQQKLEQEKMKKIEMKRLQQESRKLAQQQYEQDEEIRQQRADEMKRSFLLADELSDNEDEEDDRNDKYIDKLNKLHMNMTDGDSEDNIIYTSNNNKSNSQKKSKKSKKKSNQLKIISQKNESMILEKDSNEIINEESENHSIINEVHINTYKDGGDIHIAVNDKDTYFDNDLNEEEEGEEEEEEEEDISYHCEICEKYFKSISQLNQHLNNKQHKKKEQEMIKLQQKQHSKYSKKNEFNMINNTSIVDTNIINRDNNNNDSNNNDEKNDFIQVESIPTLLSSSSSLTKRNKKKMKKKQILINIINDREDNDDDNDNEEYDDDDESHIIQQQKKNIHRKNNNSKKEISNKSSIVFKKQYNSDNSSSNDDD